jgi:ubiquinone/menaquinone biosynthesis C-methylase UbiE
MPDLYMPNATAKGRCLLLQTRSGFPAHGEANLQPPASEWIARFQEEGWTSDSRSPDSAPIPGLMQYDFALVTDPESAPAGSMRGLIQAGTLLAAIAVGRISADAAALIEVWLCLDPKSVELLRGIGKRAHLIKPGADFARICLETIERHLRYRRERYAPVDWSRISYGHAEITPDQVSAGMVSAWKSEEIPARQRALVQTELEQMYRGNVPRVYQVLADAVRPFAGSGSDAVRLLEIGCASGYYFEILEYLLCKRLDYTGVDYSDALIRMARSLYPRPAFRVEDGAALPFPDGHFPIAISSCVLLHVPNYKDHIRETARVAGRVVIAHRTPVCRARPTQYQRKFAYGVETVELLFNEAEILEAFRNAGLEFKSSDEFSSEPAKDEYCVTYVFEKASADAEGLLRAGEEAFQAGDLESARKFFNQVGRDYPDHPRLVNDLGVLACREGDFGRALELFRRAYRNTPANTNFLGNLAQILVAMGQTEGARAIVEAHLKERPGDTEALAIRAGLPPAG